MFGLSRHAGNTHFLLPQNSVDHTRFTDIRIPSKPNLHFPLNLDQSFHQLDQLKGTQNRRSIRGNCALTLDPRFLFGREEAMVDPLLYEERVPRLTRFLTHQITFVYDYQESLASAFPRV